MYRIFLFLLIILVAGSVMARGTYLEPADFIRQTFPDSPPAPSVIWLTGELKQRFNEIAGHDPSSLRLRYWAQDERSAWILEEIGKTEPITVGVVVNAGRIERLQVLAFRESRGDEVRHPFFTKQFEGAALNQAQQLNLPIDGISGATLSVRALQRIARLALLLHRRSVGHGKLS